jgi:hypothetical protein
MAFPKSIKELCTPAFIYFAISMVGIILSAFQNIGDDKVYRVGSYSADVPSNFLIFAVKIIYILFWTWILNLICKDGHREIAWFLVLVPFILIFVVIGLIMLSPEIMESMKNKYHNKKHNNSMNHNYK